LAGDFSTQWRTESVSSVIPQQQNIWDCGMFCLKYADLSARDLPIVFKQSEISVFRQLAKYEILTNTLLC
jgi:sentrin-specific protease 1